MLTAAAYLVGSGRVFGYDSAVTFANFVATPSMLDAFAVHSQQPTIPLSTIAGNDHVLVSLISHVIYSLTATRIEVVYRVVPALAAGGAAGVAATVLTVRFGAIAGACGGLFIGSNPLFVENSRDLRGYSLAAFCAVLATVLLPRAQTGWRRWTYGLLVGLAISAHIFAGLVLAAHMVYVAVRRPRAEAWRLVPAWLLAGVVGIGANANILWIDFTQHGLIPGTIDPTFPRDLLFYLLGEPVLLTLGLWLSAAVLGLWAVRREPWVLPVLATVAAGVVVLWIGLHPAYLYPRFFVFLVPGCAYLVAAAVKRWIVLAPVVLLGVVAAVAFQVPGYTNDSLALRQAAAVVDRANADGLRACVIHSDEQLLGAYSTGFYTVTSADQLPNCDLVVVVSWGLDVPLRDLAAQEFPRATLLPAGYPAVVLER
ncbi:MAG: hypothetical protein ABI334_02520 [Candidatus Dormiibacterota bacterium]